MWYLNIESVRWKKSPPLTVGSQVDFVAHFLGHRLAYTDEGVEWDRYERFVMRTAQDRSDGDDVHLGGDG